MQWQIELMELKPYCLAALVSTLEGETNSGPSSTALFISANSMPWQRFLPRDSYAKRGICRRRVSVCLCVCLSVCHTPVLYQNG